MTDEEFINYLYLLIKHNWNIRRAIGGASPQELTFLITLMEKIEEHTDAKEGDT